MRQSNLFDPTRGPLRSFLLVVTRNLVLKRWRDERRCEELEDDACVVPPVDIKRLETSEAVADAVRALPPLQRGVLILAEYEGLSFEEIARAVESEIGTVKSMSLSALHRSRSRSISSVCAS